MQSTLDELLALTEQLLCSLHTALEPHRGPLAETPSGKETLDVVALAWLSVHRTRDERGSGETPDDTALHATLARIRRSDP